MIDYENLTDIKTERSDGLISIPKYFDSQSLQLNCLVFKHDT